MRENFVDTTESILRFKTSRDPLVRKMVITLIPTLAVYDTQTFSEHFLHKAMGHLLTLLSKSNERSFGTARLATLVFPF
jgi:serine/threonine-protein kinase mTOR